MADTVRKCLGIIKVGAGLHLEVQVLAPKGDDYYTLDPTTVAQLGTVLQRLGKACQRWQKELERES